MRWFILLLLCAAAISGIVWKYENNIVGMKKKEDDLKKRRGMPASVVLAKVQRRDLVSAYEATGAIEAPLDVKISPKVTGRIEFLQVHEGDRVRKGQVLVKLAKKHKRILQTGSMQRSDAKFIKACEYVRNGRIGKIKRVLVGLPGVNYVDNLKKDGKPLSVPDSEPPAELNYDMWLGPAPFRPYNVNHVHYLFRFFWDFSGGQMTNWGAHHLDITQWGLGMDESGPIEAVASAEFNKEKLYETPTTFHITYKYANGTVVECDSGGNKQKHKNGATFEGEKGTIYVNRGALTFDPEGIEEVAIKDDEIHLYPEFKGYAKQRSIHHVNWLDCIKTRKEPVCSVTVGHHSAVVCHLGNIAVRTGKKVQWDPVKEEITGDAELAKWATKAYRAPWKLPEV